jgi:hypothetical protein
MIRRFFVYFLYFTKVSLHLDIYEWCEATIFLITDFLSLIIFHVVSSVEYDPFPAVAESQNSHKSLVFNKFLWPYHSILMISLPTMLVSKQMTAKIQYDFTQHSKILTRHWTSTSTFILYLTNVLRTCTDKETCRGVQWVSSPYFDHK